MEEKGAKLRRLIKTKDRFKRENPDVMQSIREFREAYDKYREATGIRRTSKAAKKGAYVTRWEGE